jgi:ParB/RepB/Spo0J family partition protein
MSEVSVKPKKVRAPKKAAPPPTDRIVKLPAEKIIAGNNDRKTFDEVELATLAASIDKHGLSQPVTVRPRADGMYEIVAGERRTRAMRDVLKWSEIPCVVRELDDESAAAVMLAENTARADLNPMEEAEGYDARMKRFGWTVEKTAEVAGRSVQLVKERLQLIALADDIQALIRAKQMPLGHAIALTGLDNNRQRIALRVWNTNPQMTLAVLKSVVKKLADEQIAESQLGMFELALIAEVAASAPTVRWGKAAKTAAPINKKLPPVRVKMTDTVGDILDRHIHDLLVAGHTGQAEALGNLYNTLVSFKWTSVPSLPMLPTISATDETAEDAAHVERL